MNCPLCGRKMRSKKTLHLDATGTKIVVGDKIIPVFPREAEILQVLAEAHGKWVMCDDFIMKVYGTHDEPITAWWSIQRHLVHLRRRLKDTGYKIETKWGRAKPGGYRLARV